MPTKTFQYPSPAYKHMTKMNKEFGRASHGVIRVGDKFRVEKRVAGKTYNDKKQAHQSFNLKNTTTIKGKNIKKSQQLGGQALKVKMKSIEKSKQEKIARRRAFLKKDMEGYKGREIKKVRREQLKRGEDIKSERRELLKKGKL